KSRVISETSLEQEIQELDEVSVIEIKPDGLGDNEVEISKLKLTPKMISAIPTAQNDVFKAIKFLPGISGGDLYSPIFSARGGDPSENLIMLDGITMYNPYHFANSSGIFNLQTVKNIDLLVGGFGAEYGGRNSSILNIITKDGDRSGLHGEFEPTTTHTRLFLEFPAGKDATAMISGRYYYDLPNRFMMYSNSWFYDANFSYTKRLNKYHRLKFKVFSSRDRMDLELKNFYSYLSGTVPEFDFYDNFNAGFDNKWGTHAGTLILNSMLSPKIFWRNQIYASYHKSESYSDLEFILDMDDIDEHFLLRYSTQFDTRLSDLSTKSTLSFKLSEGNSINTGFTYNAYTFENAANINNFSKGVEKRSPNLFAAFIEDKARLGILLVRAGLRTSYYSYYKKWLNEPRLNASLNVSDRLNIKAAWGHYYQYITSMNTQEYEINQLLEYYYPLQNRLPAKSIHYILGAEYSLNKASNLKLDVYYKEMPRVYSFDLNQSEIELVTFSDKLIEGSGYAYGFEILATGKYKHLSGWLSYGYSQSFRKYPEINNNHTFIFDYNRPHSLKAILNWQITERFSYSTSLQFQSGLSKTLETTIQDYYTYNPAAGQLSYYPQPISTNKNNAHLPATINLNIGVKKEIRAGFALFLSEYLKSDQSYLTINISNLLFLRRNVTWYFYNPMGKRYIPIGLNYFPGVTVGYTIKF
ncbi:MAG: TonB-dependent receptor plug domain-containing protein, partial [Bacteroidales bacterium]|nr:TonB-dependent receptor plug domain-containing protein [Bacteroidales bacterium]